MKQLKQLDQTKAVRILLLLLLDAVMINLASFLALFVRMELNMTAVRESGFLTSVFRYAPLDTICTVAVFWLFRLYNSLWAYAGTVELTRVAAASMAATCLKYVGMELLSVPAPKSFPVLCCLFLMALVGVSRLAYRYVRDITQRRSKRGAQKRTMLIGAGDAGATALREFQNSQHSSNQVLCIIDDAAHKRGQLLRGVPIVGAGRYPNGCRKIPDSGNHFGHSLRLSQAAERNSCNLSEDEMHLADSAGSLSVGQRRSEYSEDPQCGN